MIDLKELSILLMVGDVLLLGILMHTQTFIGEKGRRNQLILLILIALLGACLIFCEIIDFEEIPEWDTIFFIVLGLLLIFSSIFFGRRILKESEDNIIVEHMTNVTAYKATPFTKENSSINGYVDGVYTPIYFSGPDQIWISRIKESGQTEITVLRYASSKRVYDIVLPQYYNIKDRL